METKKCECCHKIKPLSDFSKSYKNRCKNCVSEQTREKRRQIQEPPLQSERKQIDFSDPEYLEYITRENRRYEIAKELLPGRIASACGNAHRAVQEAVEYADLLIAELQKGEVL